MSLDPKFTKKMEVWLNTPAADRDIAAGAQLLLLLNHNRMLYQNILRSPQKMASKLEYELSKYLTIRQLGLTVAEVPVVERRILASADESLGAGAPDTDNTPVVDSDKDQPAAKFIGKRADHDSLPEEIQNLYVLNGDIYYKMKAIRSDLMEMLDKEPCDREELCHQLGELDKEYRKNWNVYDNFKIGDPVLASVPSVKEVAAARKYISANRQKLEELDAASDEAKQLIEAIQQRIDIVLLSGGSFKDDYKADLERYGLKCE